MTVVKVPHPPEGSLNPDRPASALLLAQVVHLHEAEKNLPLRYRSERYIKAVRTEGEAANYIREVTEAIHNAHEEARRRRFAMGRNAATEMATADTAGPRRKGSGARGRAKKGNKARGRRRG
jgi:hypothetical protein